MHAHVVRDELDKLGDVCCYVVPVDGLNGSPLTTWTNADSGLEFALPCLDGTSAVDVRELDAIWWRRAPVTQVTSTVYAEPNYVELINNDCAAAVVGLLDVAFQGAWVSTPSSTRRAENKIIQLHAARASGLRVPNTIVTQSAPKVLRFVQSVSGPIVVKALRGVARVGLPTSYFAPQYLARVDSIQAAPAIYQEYIPGSSHLRVHCFGDRVLTALIESDDLDWRGDLTVPFRRYALPQPVTLKILSVLRRLGLRMGIVDLKIAPNGEYVWLEVNPQGQFLFVEALVEELNLAPTLAQFLREEARAGRDARRHDGTRLRRRRMSVPTFAGAD